MEWLLGSGEMRVEGRDAVDQRPVRARVLEQRDRVPFHPHPPGEYRGRGECLSRQDLAPERKRSPQREARVGMRRARDEPGAEAASAFQLQQEMSASLERAARVEGEKDVAVEPDSPRRGGVSIFARSVDRSLEGPRPFGGSELERHQSPAGAPAGCFAFPALRGAGNGTNPGFRIESGSYFRLSAQNGSHWSPKCARHRSSLQSM